MSSPSPELLPSAPSRVLIAGDSHGDPAHIEFLLAKAGELSCQAILHAGDLGYNPKHEAVSFLSYLWLETDRLQIPLYFVEGNHDDLGRLFSRPYPQIGPFRLVAPPRSGREAGVWHVPRGSRWSWQGVRFLGVGGAASIDSGLRERGVDWFPEEVVSDEEVAAIVADNSQVDVCVFHEMPKGAPYPRSMMAHKPSGDNRARLATICEAVRPALIMHGHYHFAYQGQWRNAADHEAAAIVGLDCDTNPEESFFVLDLAAAKTQFDGWRNGERPELLPR